MNFHTDLALERREYCVEQTDDGVIFLEREAEGIKITDVEIRDERGERLLKKPRGKYVTLESDRLYYYGPHRDSFIEVLASEIRRLLPEGSRTLVVGLGNDKITPDALGPRCISEIFSTRHLTKELKEHIGLTGLRSVCAAAPGVLGQTGIEASEAVKGLADRVKPDFIIAIDALASRNISRLGTTVQLCDSGISPGSGVGNHRKAIDETTLGVPVIAIGVPTVVDGATMTVDILEKSGVGNLSDDTVKEIENRGRMLVTPKEIDELIGSCAHIIAMAVNLALQPELGLEEVKELVG